jgi:hypothetical protein
MSNPFLPEGYRFLPAGYLPLVQACTLLAFDDLDFIKHLTEVRIIKNSSWPEGRENRVPKTFPEIDVVLAELWQRAAAGRTTIIARRPEARSSGGEYPAINEEYEQLERDFCKFNEPGFNWMDPFCISNGDPFKAKWFYPAIEIRDLDKLREPKSRARLALTEPRRKELETWLLRRVGEIKAQGKTWSLERAWDEAKVVSKGAARPESFRGMYVAAVPSEWTRPGPRVKARLIPDE